MIATLILAAAVCSTPNSEAQFRPFDRSTFIHQPSKAPDGTEVDVRFTVASDGTTSAVSIARTSEDMGLDRAALNWAAHDTFKPKTVDCTPVASEVTVHLRYYAPWESLLRSVDYKVMKWGEAHPAHRVTEYVRACSSYQTMSDAEFAKAQAQEEQQSRAQVEQAQAFAQKTGTVIPIHPSDADIVAVVKNHDPETASASILVHDLQAFNTPGTANDKNITYAVEARQSDGSTRLERVTFSPQATFLKIDQVNKHDLSRAYQFSRSTAAWMLLNDLLGGDTVVPRLGCVRALKVSADAPGIGREIYDALMTVPQTDPRSQERALTAYRAFAADREVQKNDLTRATLAQLGNSPTITFVYRDRDTLIGGDPEIDIVRLGTAAQRTYATLYVTADGKASMSSPPLCLVGDNRCAEYYVWP